MRIILAGASVRAAAASALRAGFEPWCVDLFADADLCRACPVVRLESRNYPHGFVDVLAGAPPGPWMYTGALENYPEVIAGIDRPLWGNPPEVLRRVRDPLLVADVLGRRQLPCPAVCIDHPPRGRPWLVKPRRSAGGAHVRFHDPRSGHTPRHSYFQEYLEGPSFAASFLAHGSWVELIGVTRQLVGEPWLHAEPFHYCGSIGPVDLSDRAAATLRTMGDVLGAAFQLRGLFGVDFILHGDQPWPVEVNPRYTASVEILERVSGRALLSEAVGSTATNPVARQARQGKAILFAPRTCTWPSCGPWDETAHLRLDDPSVPFADLPAPGTIVHAGHPLCTIFAAADTTESCMTHLQETAATLKHHLFGEEP